ncbi:MAG TPA: hypothetical protein VFZ65_00140 [Planctomycetota bacterium]|nr:hypothetical protein [Planctomycetota bacterium]
MGFTTTLLGLAALLPQAPAPSKTAPRLPQAAPPEVVLAGSADPVALGEFGLGDGGTPANARDELRWSPGGCTTSGGVRVECRAVGVKLTFPSGRELLVATDGNVHLRSGESAGPFPGGLELRLGDGALVRIWLAPDTGVRLRDVTVTEGERVLEPWWRGDAARRLASPAGWAGLRFCCCGDGGDLYRAVALGPLLVLDRVLVESTRADAAPRERLVVLTAPIRQSLDAMGRQHREPDARVRRTMTAVAAISDRSDSIFPVGAALHRAEHDKLRWLLRGGFELQLDLDGPLAPRLALFAGDVPVPMVEWTLNSCPAAFVANPRDDRTEKRWHGNGTRMLRVAVDLQAREELFERGYALRVIRRLQK